MIIFLLKLRHLQQVHSTEMLKLMIPLIEMSLQRRLIVLPLPLEQLIDRLHHPLRVVLSETLTQCMRAVSVVGEEIRCDHLQIHANVVDFT